MFKIDITFLVDTFKSCFPFVYCIIDIFTIVLAGLIAHIFCKEKKSTCVIAQGLLSLVAVLVVCIIMNNNRCGMVLGIENDYYIHRNGKFYMRNWEIDYDNSEFYDSGYAFSNHGLYTVKLTDDDSYALLGQLFDGYSYKKSDNLSK